MMQGMKYQERGMTKYLREDTGGELETNGSKRNGKRERERGLSSLTAIPCVNALSHRYLGPCLCSSLLSPSNSLMDYVRFAGKQHQKGK